MWRTSSRISDLRDSAGALVGGCTCNEELTCSEDQGGDPGAGETYFNANCATCHSTSGDLSGLAAKHAPAVLRARFLRPGDDPAPSGTDRVSVGRREHLKLLERYSNADVRNVLAFLRAPAR